MYPTPQETAILKEAEKLMVEIMSQNDPSHDQYHVQRVRKTALSLARQILPTPDLLIIELAALLHDILDKKYVAPEIAANPYGFLQPYFASWAKSCGLDLDADGRGEKIAKIIDNVSWTTEKSLRESGKWTSWHDGCMELHCVQDADRLDAIGAFGVMRCAAYSTVTNSPLHTSHDDPKQARTSIQHFHDKLLKIHGRLKTVPGKKLGAKRHQFLLDFLAAVDEEYNGC